MKQDKLIKENNILNSKEGAEIYFKNLILEIDEETFITPDINEDEDEGSIHRISSFTDSEDINDFCDHLNIESNNLFLSIASFVLSKFVYNKNLIFANSGTCDDQSFEDYPLILNLDTNLNVKSFLAEINDTWQNSIVHHTTLSQIVNDFGFEPKFLYQFNDTASKEDNYNLILNIVEKEETFELTCKFNDALYSPELINTFLNSILIVLNKIIELSDDELENTYLKDISIVNREIPNAEDLEFVEVEELLIHKIFEKQVEQHGDEVILTASDGEFTYNEINENANSIANALIKRGVEIEDKVMFILRRESNVFKTAFGILKAGACFIPIDSDYPDDRIEHVLKDSGSKYIIIDDIVDIKNIDLSAFSDKLLDVNELLEEEDTSNPNVDVSPENLVYLIYTSGSTGLPKGVMIEHRNLANYVYPHPENLYTYELVTNRDKENYKVLSTTTVAFDVFQQELMATLLNNIPVVFANDIEYQNPIEMLDLIKRTNPNVYVVTPSRLLQYLEIDEMKDVMYDFKAYLIGGEALPPRLYDLLSKNSKGKIYNLYGPTEATVYCNTCIVDSSNVSVGRPMLNVYEEIMDSDSNPLPPNVIGELYIAGKGVCREYYNRPDKNEEAFRIINGIKFYRSGDFAKVTEDGRYFIFGRMDNQIKLRGFRIEIGEVESAIKEFEGIKSLAVALKNIKGNDHLCAYFTVYDEYKKDNEEYSIDIDKLKEHLQETLTYYMVPTVYMELDEIPETANGKTDVKNLPEPVLKTENVMPENEVQRKLHKMCSEILNFEDFGVTDNLFSLGFSSLSIMKLSHEINSEFGVVLAFKTLMDVEDIRDLENLVNNASKVDKIVYEKQDYYPLSHNQLNVYIESVKNPDKLIYNMFYVVEMGEDINPKKLRRSLINVFNHHPYLKSTITQKDGDVLIKRQDDAEVYVDIINRKCDSKAKDNFIRPYDLLDSPLYRAEIYNYDNKTTLLIDIHHIIFDGMSMNIFIKNLINDYLGDELLEEGYTGFEYILEDYRQETSDSYRESEEFFNSKINEIDISTEISPNITKSMEDAKLGEYYNPMSKKSIDKYCKEYNITPNNLFLSATLLTLSKYTYSKDMLIATISSGRLNPNYENTLAMVVKTIPFIHRIDTNQSVGEYYNSVQNTLTETINHENYPYTKLFEEYGINPNIFYAYQVGVDGKEVMVNDKGNLNTLDIREVSLDLPKFNLSVYIEEDEDNYLIFLRYNDAFYSRDFIIDLTDNIELMVKKLQKDFDGCVKDISLLPSEEEEKLAETHNSFKNIEINSNLKELFEESVAKFGDEIVLVEKNQGMSYNQLNSNANKIANSLVDLGVAPGDHVILKIERSTKLIAAIYAVIKTGASFTIVSTEQPEEQTEFIKEDTNAKLIIRSDVDELLANDNDGNIDVDIKSDDLACIVYTSGSTGKPKGVKITHKGLINYINPREDNIALHAIQNDVSNMLSLTTTTFIAFLREALATIINGTKVTLTTDEESKNLSKIIRLIKESGVDGLSLTPSRIQEYMKVTEFKDLLNQFNIIIIGGEKFIPSVYTDLNSYSDAKIFNSYGSSENTIATHQKLIDSDEITEGTPIPNNIDLIIDIDGNPLPNNIIGEACTAGVQTTPGYLNRDDLNVSEFITINNLRFYKTGDLAYKNSNNELVIRGRKDKQIKLRGLRIEPGEIESAISKYPGIESVAVTVKQINKQDSLCAFYTSNDVIDVEDLKEYLSTKLIRYMIPASFTQLDSMPKTPNGKIDTKNLPNPEISSQHVLPENELEESIFEICSDILGFDDFGVTDNLYELGFTSLSIMRLSTEIYDKLEKEINVTLILQKATIRNIAENIEINEVSDIVGESDDEHEYYRLTPNQLGVYFDCVKDYEKLNYNLPKYIELGSDIDENRLKSAIIDVINSHPYMKTRIVMKDGEVFQETRDSLIIDDLIEIVELDNVDEDYKREFIKPFDLSEGPLFRFRIIKNQDNVSLLCDFHHIIVDGTSLNILFDEIAKTYDGIEFETEEINGFEYSLNEVKIQESSLYKESELFFFNKIKEFDSPTLMTPDLSGDEHDGVGVEKVIFLEKDEIDAFCNEASISQNNFFLAVSSFVLSKFAYAKDLLISTITNGRFNPNQQKTLAMMVKTLPITLNINSDLTIKEFFEYTNKEWFDVLTHSSYPLTEISNKYGFMPEFLYAFHGNIVEDIKINGNYVKREALDEDVLKFKLNLGISEIDEKYEVSMIFNDQLYSDSLIQTFLDSFSVIVNKFTTFNKDTQLKDISIVETNELSIDDLNFVELDEYRLNKIFEKQVELHPDDIAIYAEDGDFTFDELNTRANRIANALIKRGVVAEDKVMFILKRNSNVFASIFGILKSGAAFIPVDSDYPKDRVEHVLTDSESKFIIVDEIVDIKNIDLSEYSDNIIHISELLEEEDTSNPDPELKGENLAYIIYTSGSTGLPKGVMLEHKNLGNFVYPDPKNVFTYDLATSARKENLKALSISTVAFDMLMHETMTSLLNGIPVVFANDEEYKNPLTLCDLINRTGANVYSGTPSRLLQYLELEELNEAFSKFKIFAVGGEVFPAQLLDVLPSDARIYNIYGPTETTVCSNTRLIDDGELKVGKPLFNVHESIMDLDANPLPPNVIGELYIAGYGVSRAYLNRPEKNAEAYTEINGIRFYRSGDYAKLHEDGDVSIYGRLDNQIKLRGLRIEIGEIESIIADYEPIKSLAVVVRKIHDNDHLCAYFTVHDEFKDDKRGENEFSFDIEELKGILSEKLTYYMVPTVYMELDEMPQTLNGKTDLKNLPEPVLVTEYIAPENEVEAFFANTFAEILDLDNVSVTDSFFEIGGTSLLVTKITLAALERDYEVNYGDVFKNPTPRMLADFILEESGSETSDESRYDYSKINALLKKNNLQSFVDGELDEDLGTVLLTGATGFLGIHVLRELIESESGDIYCFVRSRGSLTGEDRLKSLLFFYFADNYEELFNERLFVVEGDITDFADFEKLIPFNIDTVINCAANVKHFSSGTDIEDINLGGVINGLKFAKMKGAKYVQVSTYSVAGESIDNFPPMDVNYTETDLFIGQGMDNQYISSKFLAERAVLEAAVEDDVKVKVIRVGNLMARSSDSEFQINFESNGFINRLKAFVTIGKVPYSKLSENVEFSPIDTTAKSIVELSKTPDDCRVFHAYNPQNVTFADIVRIIRDIGLIIDPVEEDEYHIALEEALTDKSKQDGIRGILTSIGEGQVKKEWVPVENRYTMQILYRLGVNWDLISEEYIYYFVKYLNELGFFDI